MQLTIIKREQSYKSSLGGKHEDRKKKKKRFKQYLYKRGHPPPRSCVIKANLSAI